LWRSLYNADRLPELLEVTPEGGEVVERALLVDEQELLELTGRVVDEDQASCTSGHAPRTRRGHSLYRREQPRGARSGGGDCGPPLPSRATDGSAKAGKEGAAKWAAPSEAGA